MCARVCSVLINLWLLHSFQGKIWNCLPMQGEIERLDARRESGEHHEEGRQTRRAERSRHHAALTASAVDSVVRLHWCGETDICRSRIVRFFSRTRQRRRKRKIRKTHAAGLHLNFHHLRIDGGELFERVIDDDFVLTERSCAVFMRQICEGLEFMHGQKILHLDLKVSHWITWLMNYVVMNYFEYYTRLVFDNHCKTFCSFFVIIYNLSTINVYLLYLSKYLWKLFCF